MRLVQLAVPEADAPAIERALEDEGVDYYRTAETSDKEYGVIIHFSVEAADVEPTLDRVYEAGLDSDDHGIIVDVETDLFEEIERDRESESTDSPHARIADAELRTEAGNQILDPYSFVLMTALSAVVATIGLILDSAAVIIGAMVIAPLLGPALSSTVGTVVDDQTLFRRGVAYQVGGIAVAIASATALAWALRVTRIAPPGKAVTDTAQIAQRLSPDVLALGLALAAGGAGVLSLATRTKSAIVGVMIAAAIVPPAATTGIGLAWNLPVVAFDSATLVVVNLLAINLAGLAVFWYLGYRPWTWLGVEHTRKTVAKRSAVLVLAILVVSVPLAVNTHSKVQGAGLEDRAETAVRSTLDRPQYDGVSVGAVRVVTDSGSVAHLPERVVVELGIPPTEHFPDLSERVAAAVTDRADREIGVRVEYAHVARPVTVDAPETGNGTGAGTATDGVTVGG